MITPISRTKWNDVKKQVKLVNPALFEVIDSLSINKELDFIKVSYPYGVNVLENGELNIPLEMGKVVPISHPDVADSTR